MMMMNTGRQLDPIHTWTYQSEVGITSAKVTVGTVDSTDR